MSLLPPSIFRERRKRPDSDRLPQQSGIWSLPIELVLEVVREMDSQSLARISATSAKFHALSIPILYQTVVIDSLRTLSIFCSIFVPGGAPLRTNELGISAAIKRRLTRMNPFVQSSANRRRKLLEHTRHLSVWMVDAFHGYSRAALYHVLSLFPSLISAQMPPLRPPPWPGTLVQRVERLYTDLWAYMQLLWEGMFLKQVLELETSVTHLYIACNTMCWRTDDRASSQAPFFPRLQLVVIDMAYTSWASLVLVTPEDDDDRAVPLTSLVTHFVRGCNNLKRIVVRLPRPERVTWDYKRTRDYAALCSFNDARIWAIEVERTEFSPNVPGPGSEGPISRQPLEHWRRHVRGEYDIFSEGAPVVDTAKSD